MRFAFLPVFGIILALTLGLFQAIFDFKSLSVKNIVLDTVFAILISVGATLLLVLGLPLVGRFLGKAYRRLSISLALYVLARAKSGHKMTVRATGIDAREGSVVVRLAVGLSEAVSIGDKFDVLNNASKQRWGTLEAIEVEGTSCLCRVFDRMNSEFWGQLESRMRRDPSPPAGVTFSRYIDEELLLVVEQFLRAWGR